MDASMVARLKELEDENRQLGAYEYSINFWSGVQNQLQYVAIMDQSLSAMNSLIRQKNVVLGWIIFNQETHNKMLISKEPIELSVIAGLVKTCLKL